MFFKLDDSSNPGWAEVTILKESGKIAGKKLYKIEIKNIVKITERKVKIGQKLTVTESHLYANIQA
jgi:hypothetical protein